MGSQFWLVCLKAYFFDVHPHALRDGECCTYGSIAPSPFCHSPFLLSFSALPSSFYSLHVSWLSGALSREALREACPSANTSQFFDPPIPSKLGQQKRSALEERCIVSNWNPSDGLISVGKHSSGGIPHDRPMKSSKLSPQHMIERDEVGGSSGTIPPHCVPIKSLGGTCPGDSELDLGTSRLQYSTAGLLWWYHSYYGYAVCEYRFIVGETCAATTEFDYQCHRARLCGRLQLRKGPWLSSRGEFDGDGVSLGPCCGHAAMVTRFILICFVPFLVPRV